jgi:hypothetical protein
MRLVLAELFERTLQMFPNGNSEMIRASGSSVQDSGNFQPGRPLASPSGLFNSSILAGKLGPDERTRCSRPQAAAARPLICRFFKSTGVLVGVAFHDSAKSVHLRRNETEEL